METKFKIGDKVRLVKDYCFATSGMTGTVCGKEEHIQRLAVEFDEAFQDGHDCDGLAMKGHGHWIPPEHLEKIPSESWKIVIIGEGDTTKAKAYEDGKLIREASVKRYWKDTPDRAVAIRAVCERLAKPDESKSEWYNGKVVCVERSELYDRYLTVGKIYQFKDGLITIGDGKVFGWRRCRDLEDFSVEHPNTKLLEIVE